MPSDLSGSLKPLIAIDCRFTEVCSASGLSSSTIELLTCSGCQCELGNETGDLPSNQAWLINNHWQGTNVVFKINVGGRELRTPEYEGVSTKGLTFSPSSFVLDESFSERLPDHAYCTSRSSIEANEIEKDLSEHKKGVKVVRIIV